MALQITDANFEEYANSGKPMVLDFWAEWCGPCRMVSPIIDELAQEYEGKVVIGKMDVTVAEWRPGTKKNHRWSKPAANLLVPICT